MTTTIISFIFFLLLMVASGAFAVINKKKTSEDYLVASQGIAPWLSALSAVATNNSGFMFVGMIAYSYRSGINSIWMMVGWVLGDLFAWLFIHSKVRELSSKKGVNTISQLIGGDSLKYKPVVIFIGFLTFIFLGIYASAQLKSGSIALHTLFEWDLHVGVLIGTAIVVIYSFAGGIRADIWTDAAQSFVMIVSMGLLLIVGLNEIGGVQALFTNLKSQDKNLVQLFPEGLKFGFVPYLIGFTMAGFGTVGQPHLMTRYMAIESVEAIKKARLYYFMWYVPFFLLSIGVGLISRAILPDLASLPLAQGLEEPTELALPFLTMQLLPNIFVGFSLAGLFAATISTADSQIIVCSGAITHDMFPKWKKSYLASKIGTFTVTALAVFIALFAPEGVFGLVLVAWSALGASIGPVLLLKVMNKMPEPITTICMMSAAIITVSLWHISPWNEDVFKIFPGVLASTFVYFISWVLRKSKLG